MNRVLRCATALAGATLFLAMTSTALAQFPDGTVVEETLHNMLQSTGSPMDIDDYGEICVYCHTPHEGNAAIEAPLWNRAAPTGPFTMYTSSSIDMTIASSPLGVSLACLSCHDGTIAVDEIINVPNAFSGTPGGGDNIADCAGCHSGSSPPGGFDFSATNMGQDLSNDHPISITYDPGADPDFNPAGSVEGAGLPLPSGRVECSSCHEPHSAQWRPFLQISNANSAMCTTCHIK